MTDDFHPTSRNGVLKDRNAALAFAKTLTLPADLKIEVLKTTVYGDTVLQVKKESWSGSDGSKMQMYVNVVFVKQAGVWNSLLARPPTSGPVSSFSTNPGNGFPARLAPAPHSIPPGAPRHSAPHSILSAAPPLGALPDHHVSKIFIPLFPSSMRAIPRFIKTIFIP